MKDLSKIEAKNKIEDYFSKNKLEPRQTRKIKRFAMAHRIRLKEYRKRFCKKCYSELSNGIFRLSKRYKTVECNSCEKVNRWKM